MNIAVVDVAAESGGALSVLEDFVDTIVNNEGDDNDEWFIITSVVRTRETKRVHNIRFPEVKRSWGRRLVWEYMRFPRIVKEYAIDIVFSLQNNAMPMIKKPQVVYFHNVLLSQQTVRFSFCKKDERLYAVYTKFLAPYIRRSWRWANKIITQSVSVRNQIQRYVESDKIEVCRPRLGMDDDPCKTKSRIKGYIYPAIPQSYKNFEAVVYAASKLEEINAEVEILLTIDGNENEYAKKIKELANGIKSVKLIGFLGRNEVLKKYSEYGLVITSKIESYGVPILGAMAVGTVIVGVNRDYIREHAEYTGYNRIYLSEGDLDLFHAMMEGMQDDKESNYIMPENDGMKKVVKIVKNQYRELW